MSSIGPEMSAIVLQPLWDDTLQLPDHSLEAVISPKHGTKPHKQVSHNNGLRLSDTKSGGDVGLAARIGLHHSGEGHPGAEVEPNKTALESDSQRPSKSA